MKILLTDQRTYSLYEFTPENSKFKQIISELNYSDCSSMLYWHEKGE